MMDGEAVEQGSLTVEPRSRLHRCRNPPSAAWLPSNGPKTQHNQLQTTMASDEERSHGPSYALMTASSAAQRIACICLLAIHT